MPNARELQLQPVPEQVVIPREDRVANAINELVAGAAGIAKLGADVASNELARKNKDLAEILKFDEAAARVQREYGLDRLKEQISNNAVDAFKIRTVDDWYEVIKSQERIGLFATAQGRKPEEIVQLLKNHNVVDPENILDYKSELAKQLAMQDAAAIFAKIDQDANSYASDPQVVQKTITQHVDEMVASRNFGDPVAEQAYRMALLPIVARTNEQKMFESYQLFRKQQEKDVLNDIKLSFGLDINNGAESYDNFKTYGDAAYTKIKKLFPDKTDEEIKADIRAALGEVITKAVDPIKAQRALKTLARQAGKADPDTAEWFAVTNAVIRGKVDAEANRYVGDMQAQIKSIDNPNDLLAISKKVKGQADNGILSPQNALEILNAVSAQKTALQNKYAADLKDQLGNIQTGEGLQSFIGKITKFAKEGMISDLDLNSLVTAAQDKGQKIARDIEVEDRINQVKGTELIGFGKDHFDAIDKHVQSRLNAGLSLGQVINWQMDTFGVISDKTIERLNDLAKGGDPDGTKTVAAVTAISQVNPQYLDKIMGDKSGQLNGKFRTLAYINRVFGYDPAILARNTAGTTADHWTQSIEVLKKAGTPDGKGIKDINRLIIDAYDGWGPSTLPEVLTPKTKELATELYRYNYATLAAESPSAPPLSIAVAAQDQTEKMLKSGTKVIDFGGKNFVYSKMAPISDKDAELLSPIVSVVRRFAAADQATFEGQAIDADNLLPDFDSISIKDGKITVPIYNQATIGGRGRVIGNIEIPYDKTNPTGPADALKDFYARSRGEKLTGIEAEAYKIITTPGLTSGQFIANATDEKDREYRRYLVDTHLGGAVQSGYFKIVEKKKVYQEVFKPIAITKEKQ